MQTQLFYFLMAIYFMVGAFYTGVYYQERLEFINTRKEHQHFIVELILCFGFATLIAFVLIPLCLLWNYMLISVNETEAEN